MTVCMSRLRVSRLRRGNPKPSLGARVLARELNGETPAALLSATAEHSAPPLGLHARAKAVRVDSALVAGTIGRLTHGRTPNTVRTNVRCRQVNLFHTEG